MYNKKAVQRAQQKIWLYLLDLVSGETQPLGLREIHRRYHVSPAVVSRHLWHSFFLKIKNKKTLSLDRERKKEVKKFAKNCWKTILKNKNKKLNEILFFTYNEIW